MNPPAIPRAPAARIRLEAAQTALSTLFLERDALALNSLEGKPGADKALASHRTKIEAAERDVTELNGAVNLAERLDREVDAHASIEMRGEQFALFEKAAEARVDAMAEVLAAIEKATVAYGNFVKATEQMAVALPTATALPPLHFDGYAGHFLGNGEALIGRESFRIAGPGPKPPFAKMPALSAGDNTAAMRPGIEILREAHTAALNSVKTQCERLDKDALDRATKLEQAA